MNAASVSTLLMLLLQMSFHRPAPDDDRSRDQRRLAVCPFAEGQKTCRHRNEAVCATTMTLSAMGSQQGVLKKGEAKEVKAVAA